MRTNRLLNSCLALIPATLFIACASSDPANPGSESTDAGAHASADGGNQQPPPSGDAGAADGGNGSADGGNNGSNGGNADGGNGDGGSGNEPPPASGDAGTTPDVDGGGSETPSETESTHFFLPTVEPDNTSAPRIELDAQGGVHALYPAYAGGGAYYSYCPADCQSEDDVKVVFLPTDGTVANAMLALTKNGKPRVLLSAFSDLTYASCDDDCTDEDSWQSDVILSHDNAKEVTGEALALDPQGHPHFTIHTYRALFGIGQLEPKTEYASCTAEDCGDADAWQYTPVSDQIWEDAHLMFDAEGTAHLAFVADVMSEQWVVTDYFAAYAACSGDCKTVEDWPATGLARAYQSMTEAVTVNPSVALALTQDGKPRLLAFAVSDEGEKNLDYFECDADCTQDGSFKGTVLSNHPDIGAGIDLALDAQDRPRFVHTLDYNIALAYCDDLPCATETSQWDLTMVEASGNIPKDNIFPYPNCYVAAWFLHGASLALTADGQPRVGYQARDISGGLGQPDGPNTPECVAGTDMTWSRLALMPSYKD